MYAVAGGKGGVGKTTTTLNLATAFAATGSGTVVVDADLGMTNLGALLAVDPDHSVHDVLAGEASVDDALVEGPAGVDVLAGARSIDACDRADPANLRGVFDRLRESHDVVVADTGAGLSHASLVSYGLADGAVLVTTDDAISATDTAKTAEMVRHVDGTVLGTVVTRVDAAAAAVAAAEDVGESLLGSVPDAPEIAGDEPLVATAPDSDAAAAYEDLVPEVEDALAAVSRREAVAADPGPRGVASPTQD
jgi:septum site-determining protein MinD